MDLKERATLLASFLTSHTRPDGSVIVVKRSDAPDWVADIVYSVHQALRDSLPNDFIYQAVSDAADRIGDDGEDASPEPDYLNHELYGWLAEYPGASEYVDQAVEDYGWPASGGIFEAVQRGQAEWLAEVVQATIAALEEEEDTIAAWAEYKARADAREDAEV